MKAGSPRSTASNRPAAVPMVGGGLLPLAFILLGLAALAASGFWLIRQPDLLGLPHFHPHVVAFIHLWLPGFLLSVCIGAVYQLMPVVLGAPLRQGITMLWIHFGLHAAGVILLVASFASGRFAWAGVGGTLISVGVGILLTAVLRTFVRADRRDAPAWCFPLATGWLAATVLAGVTMAANRHSPWLPLSMMDLLRAHAHLGLAGFFLTLLQGTTFQLIPMFTMGELRRPRLVWTGLLATQAGLLALIPGLAWDHTVFIHTGAVIIAAGIACTGFALHATLRSRRRKKVEPGIQAFVLGAILLGLATLIGAGLTLVPAGSPALMRIVTAYGVILIPGALSLMVLGMLCKIVPFLVWMRAYGPKVGKQPVPIATVLASRSLEYLWLVLHLIGLALLVAGFAVAGGIALAVASAFFLANILRVLAHLRDRRAPVVTRAKLQPSP